MSDLIIQIEVSIAILVSIISSFLSYRNHRVFMFRRWIAELVFSNTYRFKEKLKVAERVSYGAMFKSIKPLKLESFFTPEEINILTSKGSCKECGISDFMFDGNRCMNGHEN